MRRAHARPATPEAPRLEAQRPPSRGGGGGGDDALWRWSPEHSFGAAHSGARVGSPEWRQGGGPARNASSPEALPESGLRRTQAVVQSPGDPGDDDDVVHHNAVEAGDEGEIEDAFDEILARLGERRGLSIHAFEYLIAEFDQPAEKEQWGHLGWHLEAKGLEGIGPSWHVVSIEKDGHIARYNQRGQTVSKFVKGSDHPDGFKVAEEIQEGDHIIKVNGHSDRPTMAQKIRDDKKLIIRLVRKSRYRFQYKQRPSVGAPIHIAAVYKHEPAGDQLLLDLIEEGANFREECTFTSRGSRGGCQAIHLAAGRGHRTIVESLVEARADVNARSSLTIQQGKHEKSFANYTPLHEAVFFQRLDTVQGLLELGARVNETNYNGTTALHACARFGAPKLATLLVQSNADPKLQDNTPLRSTPLMIAVEYGRFQHRKLSVLSDHSLNDVLRVAELSAEAASSLMRDASGAVDAAWREALHKEDPNTLVEKLVKLMHLAPQASEDVLEALTEMPDVQDEFDHPLPRRARLLKGKIFNVHYRGATKWEGNNVDGDDDHDYRKKDLSWHAVLAPHPTVDRDDAEALRARPSRCSTLGHLVCCRRRRVGLVAQNSSIAPPQLLPVGHKANDGTMIGSSAGELGPSRLAVASDAAAGAAGAAAGVVGKVFASDDKRSNGELVPVKIKVVRIRGVLTTGLLEVLANTPDHHIFMKLQTQAVLEYAWKNLVEGFYYRHLLVRSFEILLLLWWVVAPLEVELERRCVWCFLGASIHREAFYEISELSGSVLHNWTIRKYFFQLKNWVDATSIFLMLALVYWSHRDSRLSAMPELLSIIVLSRWCQLAYTFRAFPWAGQKILPIMRSFQPTGGIFLVTVFFFAGFLHAFLALELASKAPEPTKVILAAFRLLLLGDGDGIDVVLGLGDAENEGSWVTISFFVAAVFGFCICILNLFIAVHGEAYDSAQERAQTSFLQERASICNQCLLRPHWPPSGLRAGVGIYSELRDEKNLQDKNKVKEALPQVRIAWPNTVASLVFSVSLVVGFFTLRNLPWLHPGWACLIWLVGLVLADMITLQRPWEVGSDGSDVNNLWICSRSDYDENKHWISATTDDSSMDVIEGRLGKLKYDNNKGLQKITENILMIKKSFQHEKDEVLLDIHKVGHRLEHIESLVEELIGEVKGQGARQQLRELRRASEGANASRGDQGAPPSGASPSSQAPHLSYGSVPRTVSGLYRSPAQLDAIRAPPPLGAPSSRYGQAGINRSAILGVSGAGAAGVAAEAESWCAAMAAMTSPTTLGGGGVALDRPAVHRHQTDPAMETALPKAAGVARLPAPGGSPPGRGPPPRTGSRSPLRSGGGLGSDMILPEAAVPRSASRREPSDLAPASETLPPDGQVVPSATPAPAPGGAQVDQIVFGRRGTEEHPVEAPSPRLLD